MNKIIKNKRGQSTIEFLCSFAFIITILFVYVKIAMNLTNGYVVHYATYVASRVFLTNDNFSKTADGADGNAETQAKNVFGKIIKGGNVDFKINKSSTVNNKVFVGAIAIFQQTFAFSDLIGGKNPIKFVSESFLGRLPTHGECGERICDAVKAAGATDCTTNVTITDDGC